MSRARRELVAAAIVAARPTAEAALRRAPGVHAGDVQDLLHDACVVVLRALQRGFFVLPERDGDLPPVVAAYLTTVAWRLARDHVHRRSREPIRRPIHEPSFDPRPWLEARSELRALSIPPDVLPILLGIAEGSDVAAIARELDVKPPTAYDRYRRFRQSVKRRGNRGR